jgi:hypothetical protein
MAGLVAKSKVNRRTTSRWLIYIFWRQEAEVLDHIELRGGCSRTVFVPNGDSSALRESRCSVLLKSWPDSGS